ncbi:hypothetical protein, partial [Halomonas alkalicola]|uniref:hypothetical protein n=1 Tax=Halomonas alkalicola TaxID=1930622 RepID=UPI0035E4D512
RIPHWSNCLRGRCQPSCSKKPRLSQPVLNSYVFLRHYIGYRTEVDHESALIRVFAREPHGSFYDGIDIFITFYLRTKEGADQLDFGRKRRDLQDSLDRERKAEGKGDSE